MTTNRILSWTPSAVVFDCDGTLMDTERHWQQARDTVLRDRGFEPPPGFAQRSKGLHYIECGRLMAEEAGQPYLAEEMTAALLEAFTRLVAEDPATMPGAAELVRTARRFAPLAVASNCPIEVVESCLDTVGLIDCFDHIVVPGGQVRPKPHPDVYLTAVRHCGAAPGEALAVEDSHCGIRAAVDAGMRVLGVGPWPGDEVAASVDLWVRSLDEPRVLTWARGLIPSQRA